MKRVFTLCERGSFVAIGAVLTIVMGILLLAISKMFLFNNQQALYLESMNKARRIAETGMSQAAGKIKLKPSEFDADNGITVSIDGGTYQNVVSKTNLVGSGGYYIMTISSVVVGGKTYASRLHSHVRISNAGDYFAALMDSLEISDGANIEQGRIYAPKLTFYDTTPTVTKVLSAEFVDQCTPPINWNNATKSAIVISEPAYPDDTADIALANQPKQLTTPILFPQVLETDLARYKTTAGPHTIKNVFTGEIFPPGYGDGTGPCSAEVGDTYASHSCNNADHIYYSTDNIRVEGRVHGQVLFISEKDIYITGNLISAEPTDSLPGAGYASSSTAHQAILITRGNVIVDNTFYNPAWATQELQKIECFILAPHGELRSTSYDSIDPAIRNRLSLKFTGSMILNHLASSFSQPFNGNDKRVYLYMESLKENPPPYLPAIIDVVYSLEERVGGSF